MGTFKKGDRVEVYGYSDYWDGPATVLNPENEQGYVHIQSDERGIGGFSPRYLRRIGGPVVEELEPVYRITAPGRPALDLTKDEAQQVINMLNRMV